MTAMHPIEPRGSARAKRSRRSRAGAVAPPAGVVAGAAQVSPAGPAQVDPSPQAAGASLGSYLRQQRERRAMSVAELARITRIPSTSLEAMEADRFDELPGEVFVRGFLRAYAQAVRLLPAEVLARYTSSRRASSSATRIAPARSGPTSRLSSSRAMSSAG